MSQEVKSSILIPRIFRILSISQGLEGHLTTIVERLSAAKVLAWKNFKPFLSLLFHPLPVFFWAQCFILENSAIVLC